MIRYLKATWGVFYRYRFLLMNLVNRDIKVKYRRSTLGLLWSILNPLLMMLVMWLVFGTLFKGMASVDTLPTVSATGLPPAFPVYLISGQLIFSFYSDATNMAMDSVLGNAQLIKKVYIPKYIFPLEKVAFGLINILFSMVALILVVLFTGSPVTPWVFLAPVTLGLLFLFNTGVGLILSAVVVFFRDVKHLYTVFVLALTYMTPIFYSEAIMKDFPFGLFVIRLNPVYWYVSMFRQLVVYGRAPTSYQWIATVSCAAVAFLLGLVIFRKKQDDFILYL